MRQLPHLAVAMLCVLAAPIPVRAAVCTVDPAGVLPPGPSTYPSVNAALADAPCKAPGTVVRIWCPGVGCTDTAVTVAALADITIASMETTAGGGPVTFAGAAGKAALRVEGSTGIRVLGVSAYAGVPGQAAIEIVDAGAEILGPTAPAGQRYAGVTGDTGVDIVGGSTVTLQWLGIADANLGLRLRGTGAVSGLPPLVIAAGVALLRNTLAVAVQGPAGDCTSTSFAQLDIRGDASTAWLNYVMENIEGVRLTGRSQLRIDHTVLAANLAGTPPPPAVNPVLFDVLDAARLEARNLLVYDNDGFPGLTGAYPGGGLNTGGSLLHHASCDASSLVASTVVNNGTDVVFAIEGSGQLTLDHTLVAGNWGKVLSMSSYYVATGGCPPVTPIASNFRRNRLNADPAVCLPPISASTLNLTWNPNVTVSAATPRTLAAYPDVVAPWTDLYLIRRRQPIPYALPPGLFVGRPWSVDGVNADTGRLDVGYHNPQ